MANVDIATMPAQASYVTFDALRLGRSSQEVVGRLLRFWDAKNVKKDGEFMGIVLLFLDEKCSVIHGFIPATRAEQYRSILREGVVFNLGGFEVGRCTNLYRVTDHPFVIRFLPTTSMIGVADVGHNIEKEKFMLRKFDHLKALANTNLELPDVVGKICFVQGSNLTDLTSTDRLVVRFQIDMSAVVYLSLWDDAASSFRAYLSNGNNVNSVMLITTVNPKLFGGNLYLNSTPTTKFYFDLKIDAIQKFAKSLGVEAVTPFGKADTSSGIEKKEMVTIKELYDFISQSNEQTQEADFLCKATVVGVLQRNGWCYVSCADCSRKLDTSGKTFQCNKCVSPNVTGVLRYRVELAVRDGHGESTFVVFDSEMTKITTKTAASLTTEAGNGGFGNALPSCLEELAGKQFIFQIRVTPFNFTPKHRTFTVSTMTEEAHTLDAGQDDTNKSEVRADEGTTSNTADEKLPNSENGEVQKTRKRGRE